MSCYEHISPLQVRVEITDGSALYELTVLEGEVVREVDDDAPGVFITAGRNAAALAIREIEGREE